MIRRLFIHSCAISRMQPVGTNGRKQQSEIATGVKCLFVPMASRAEIDNGFQVGTGYDVYFNDSAEPVRQGDQLVWDGGTFNVRAVAAYAVPRVGHRHALATREGA